MNTEQKPSLPAREKTKNQRQVTQSPANNKDLPSESEMDSLISEVVLPKLLSKDLKDFIFNLFETDEEIIRFLMYYIGVLLRVEKSNGGFLRVALDVCEIMEHLEKETVQEKLLSKARELDKKAAEKYPGLTLDKFHESNVSRAISKLTDSENK